MRAILPQCRKDAFVIGPWVQIMDNAGSTNKKSIHAGCYIGSPAANILDYFRISFTVAGHTKFAPDQLFYLTARDVYASDVFNERELSAMMQQHASVVIVVVSCVPGEIQLLRSITIYLDFEDRMTFWHHEIQAQML